MTFLLTATSWLFAPFLNSVVSDRETLISEFTIPGMPYAWVFQTCGIIAGLLLIFMSYKLRQKGHKITLPVVLIAVLGASAIIDILAPTNCQIVNGACEETVNFSFVIHAVETLIASLALFVLTAWDALKRKRVPSTLFLAIQILYGALFITQLLDTHNYETLSQFAYQALAAVWIAWFTFSEFDSNSNLKNTGLINKILAVWVGLHGVAAIVIGMGHVDYFARVNGLYLGDDSELIGHHGVIIGLIFLYLSRHIARGERRAWQILLGLIGFEVLKYSAILPHPWFLAFYVVTFAVVFVLRDHFSRGIIPQSWRSRTTDALAIFAGSIAALAIVAYLLTYTTAYAQLNNTYHETQAAANKTNKLANIRLEATLPASAGSVLLLASVWFILYSMFKPAKFGSSEITDEDMLEVEAILDGASNSTEDFFKTWPVDKQYFWSARHTGFVAYKVVGPIAFALSDPIAKSKASRQKLLKDFMAYCRAHGWRVCFLLVQHGSAPMYKNANLKMQKIGASAVIDIDNYVNKTARNKWWRWQKNKGAKMGYEYEALKPPHSYALMQNLREVSDGWLKRGGHQEEGFALGYFDADYLQNCRLHVIKNEEGRVLAFVNELPVFNSLPQTTIDLIRFVDDAPNANNYLLYNVLHELSEEGKYKRFDIGFVPLARMRGRLANIARTLGANRFSASGLEQFKNKFEPDWQENYIAYDGDLGDLALIALHLEKAMAVEDD